MPKRKKKPALALYKKSRRTRVRREELSSTSDLSETLPYSSFHGTDNFEFEHSLDISAIPTSPTYLRNTSFGFEISEQHSSENHISPVQPLILSTSTDKLELRSDATSSAITNHAEIPAELGIPSEIVVRNTNERSTQYSEASIDCVEQNLENFHQSLNDSLGPYLSKCVDDISHKESLRTLFENLNNHGLVPDFMSLIVQLTNGVLEPTDITLLSLLDKVRLADCVSTTQMRYHRVTKLFWNLAYKEGNGKLLRFLSGPKHYGHVLAGLSEKSKFTPSTGRVNFAIPSTNTLSKDQKEMSATDSSIMKPGILDQHFPLFKKHVDYILDCDGKIVREGLVNLDEGDVDLWGFEQKPTRQDISDRLKYCLKGIETLKTDCSEDSLGNLVQQLSFVVKDLRHARVEQETRKNRLVTAQNRNPEPKKFEYGMHCYYASVYEIKNHIQSLISFIQDLCDLLALQSGTAHLLHHGNINISKHPNCKQILDENILQDFYDLQGEDTCYIRQRTETWFDLRRKAKITGSTLFNGLGLRTTTEHRKHFKEFILHEERHFSEDVRKRMEHGTEHEIDGVATLLGCIIPCFFSAEYIFHETGPQFIHGAQHKYLLEVSADGILRNESSGETIIVEIKCPAPKDEKFLPTTYDIPVYYVPQLLSEMAVNSAKSLLFLSVCTSKGTVSIVKCNFDEQLWGLIFAFVQKLYDVDFIELPSTKPVIWKQALLKKFRKYSETHCSFHAEVPLIKGYSDRNVCGNPEISPYHIPTRIVESCVTTDFEHCLGNILTNLERNVVEAHTYIRKPASEVLLFMLTNSDRSATLEMECSVPIGYGLKGKSMKCDTLQEMVKLVRVECAKNDIRIAAECFDGQWHKHVVTDSAGNPLTRFGLLKQIWGEVSKRKKENLIEQFVKESTSQTVLCKKIAGQLLVTSLKGTFQRVFQMDKAVYSYVTLPTYVHPENIRYVHDHNLHMSTIIPEEEILDETILNDNLEVEQENEDVNDEFITEHADDEHEHEEVIVTNTEDSDLETTILYTLDNNVTVEQTVNRNKRLDFFSELLHELQQQPKRETFWKTITESQLIDITANATVLNKKFQVSDMRIFEKVLHKTTKFKIFTKEMTLKAQKVNAIMNFTKGSGHVETRTYDVLCLCTLALRKLKSTEFPKEILATALCSIKFRDLLANWEEDTPVPLLQEYSPGQFYELYYKPEWCESTQIPIYRFIDPTHIITNLRVLCTQRGIEGICSKDSWLRVSEKYPKLLSAGLIVQCLDKQNSGHAKRVFSYDVEKAMIGIGHTRSAKWVRLLREFYEGCDSRGVDTPLRIGAFIRMYNFLKSLRNWNKFPAPGMYIHGIPYITYEGLMINCSSRIAAYFVFVNNTFNHRAISSLACETFFSHLNKSCPLGVPSAVQIPKIMADLVYKNTQKLNPERGFHYITTSKNVYPLHLADFNLEAENILLKATRFSFFKRHPFDCEVNNPRKKNEKKRNAITSDKRPRVGVESLRSKFYRTNEDELLTTLRLGITQQNLKDAGINIL